MKQQYAPWIRDAVPIGFEATYVGVYLASDVEARIVELEHQLDIRKAAIDAQFRLMDRVKELEKALEFYAKADAVHVWAKDGDYHQKGATVARKALGL